MLSVKELGCSTVSFFIVSLQLVELKKQTKSGLWNIPRYSCGSSISRLLYFIWVFQLQNHAPVLPRHVWRDDAVPSSCNTVLNPPAQVCWLICSHSSGCLLFWLISEPLCLGLLARPLLDSVCSLSVLQLARLGRTCFIKGPASLPGTLVQL